MNFTQQTGFVHVFMPRVVLQWRWRGGGHRVPTALLLQMLQRLQSPYEGATSTAAAAAAVAPCITPQTLFQYSTD